MVYLSESESHSEVIGHQDKMLVRTGDKKFPPLESETVRVLGDPWASFPPVTDGSLSPREGDRLPKVTQPA
jgi:hypothetical protein